MSNNCSLPALQRSADPHPDNLRSIRAYEKAGFVIISDPLETRWGRAVLMECWR
jgi:RimJ/RimL family protein N-acetyltransferase